MVMVVMVIVMVMVMVRYEFYDLGVLDASSWMLRQTLQHRQIDPRETVAGEMMLLMLMMLMTIAAEQI